MNRLCARVREILEPFGTKTNTAKRALKVLTVPLAACALVFGATSASAEQTVPFSNHIVKTVNPTGTTVNLFDYWVVNGDNDKSANINEYNSNDNTGINKGHQLKFNHGDGNGINRWTGKSAINGYGRLSFVKDMLVNGYPEIKAGIYASYNTSGTYKDESLDYLFNSASQENGKQDGKAVYNNVKGLFQLKDGYYVYDSYGSDGSDGNYAVYNQITNSFNVYDKAGVYKDNANSEDNRGQFFPFDSAKKVFEEKNDQLSGGADRKLDRGAVRTGGSHVQQGEGRALPPGDGGRHGADRRREVRGGLGGRGQEVGDGAPSAQLHRGAL